MFNTIVGAGAVGANISDHLRSSIEMDHYRACKKPIRGATFAEEDSTTADWNSDRTVLHAKDCSVFIRSNVRILRHMKP
jgi:hypothetical protein